MAAPSINHNHPQVNQQHHHNAVSNASLPASLYGSTVEPNNNLLPANPPNPQNSMYGQPWRNSPLQAYNSHNPATSAHPSPYSGSSSQAGGIQYQDRVGQFPQSQHTFQQYGSPQNHGTQAFNPNAGVSYGSAPTVSPNALLRSNPIHAGTSAFPQSRHINSPLAAGPQQMKQPQLPANTTASQFAQMPISPPQASLSGNFAIITPESLSNVVSSRELWSFAHIAQIPTPPRYNTTKVHCPKHDPRKSRNELRAAADNDPKALAKINKRSVKKKTAKINVPKAASVKTALGEKEMVDISDTSDDSSDYESDSAYSSEEEEVCPNPKSRPDEPLGATRFDTIEALWQPGSARYRQVEVVRIRKGVRDFWEVVKTVRDRWKSDQQVLKEAETAKKVKDIPLFKSRVKTQLEMMHVSLHAAWEHGHPDIVSVMGDVVPFLSVLYSLLVDRNKEGDFNGSLVLSIFKLLTRCTALNVENLEKSKLKNAISRFLKVGNDEVKGLAKKVNEVAERNANTKSKGSEDKTPAELDGAVDPKAKNTPAAVSQAKSATKTHSPDPVAGAKRRSQDSGSGQPPKKVAAGPASTGSPGANAAKPVTAPTKKTVTSSTDKKPAGQPATAKPVGHKVTPKPVNMFAGLTASKRTNANAAEKKKPGAPAAAKPVSSFSQLMRDLQSPKETASKATPKSEEQQKPETEEEKAKRIRKEKRRALRVSFKPENELLEIRYFTHDPDEELGHDASMVRDVSDVGGEGRMFKQHKDQMDAEDDDLPRIEDMFPWDQPTTIDFSDLDEKSRTAPAITRGGKNVDESPETKARKQYCNNTLVTIYTEKEDIPPTPQSPIQATSDSAEDPVSFGTPPDFVLERAARLTGQQWPPASENPESGFLEQIFSKFSNAGGHPQEPQPAQPEPQPAPQPAAAAAPNIAEILAALQGTQHQQALPAQQPAYTPAPANNNQAPALDPQIASLLAQINQQNANAGSAQPQQNTFDWSMLGQASSGGYNQNGQNSGNQYQTEPYEDPARKRYREDDGYNRNNRPQKKSKGVQYDEHGKPLFVVPCRFFAAGKCTKGDRCTFRHDM